MTTNYTGIIIILIVAVAAYIIDIYYKKAIKKEELADKLEEEIDKQKMIVLKKAMGSHYDLSWNDMHYELDKLIELARKRV